MSIKTSKTERQREKRKRWNRMSKNCGIITKRYNIHAMEMLEGEERKEQKKLLVITTENFPKLMTDSKPQIQEA